MEVKNGKSLVLNDMNVRVLGQDDLKNYLVELDAMRSGPNENNWDFRNIGEYAKTFVGTPILIAYLYDGRVLGDGHNHEEKVDRTTGEPYWSFVGEMAERPVGYITEVRTETREDGYEWLVAKGVIWRFYNRELVEKLKRTGRMSVSVETNIIEGDDSGDIEVFTAWDGLGVTILGDGVAPAVPGANIHALAALANEFKSLQVKAAAKDPPQKEVQSRNSERKGVKTPMLVNKTIVAQMQEKFPDHIVLSATDDGKVCLMEKNGSATFTYAFADTDKGEVIADRITPVALSADFSFGEDVVPVPVDTIVAEISARLASAESERDALRKEKENLATMLSEMKDSEKERRKQDAKNAAKKRLSEINANRLEDECVPEDAINEVLEAADKGEFADCEDACGEAESRVNSLCMKEIEKIDKAKADKARAMSTKHYSFEGDFTGSADKGSISALYAEMVKD